MGNSQTCPCLLLHWNFTLVHHISGSGLQQHSADYRGSFDALILEISWASAELSDDNYQSSRNVKLKAHIFRALNKRTNELHGYSSRGILRVHLIY